MKKTVLTSIILLSLHGWAYGQIISDKAIRIGIGPGAQVKRFEEVPGFVVSVGIQKNVWEDRVRVSPSFIFGQFNNFMFMDVRDVCVNSNSFQFNGELDVIRRAKSSLVIAGGGYGNMLVGYKGSHYNRSSYYSEDSIQPADAYEEAERVVDYHIGVNASIGFRINPPESKFALEVFPVNIMIGTNDGKKIAHKEYCAKINLCFKM